MSGLELFSLKGKCALITGASGYLGSAMSMALAGAGAHVILNVRQFSRGETLLKSIEACGGSAEILELDVCDERAVQDYFSHKFPGALHILINNAYNGKGGTIESSEAQDYLAAYQISMAASHNIFRAALQALRRAVQESGNASVINVGSMYGLVSPDIRIYDSPVSTNPHFMVRRRRL
ncbi:SDR family NAD(P)-dependent oxidoreductase [Pseudomonas sp. OHS18]|uniref:SDR family NAD(P)-dependent oxidoreductase n=1 Tax=Pseudomonas sp. OHS18 TaxID=3399679 RepID=UPI003A851A0A